MGDFNLTAPSVIGLETPIYQMVHKLLDSPTKAVAMRVKPGAVSVNEWHSFFAEVAGQPGHALEIVDDLTPTIAKDEYAPGSDSDAVTTGWEDQGNAAVNFGDLDDRYDLTEYARNSTAMASTSGRELLFAANASGDLTGERILAVYVGASLTLLNVSGNGALAVAKATLSIDGTSYSTQERPFAKTGRPTVYNTLGYFPFDPSDNLPWLVAQVDDFLDPTDNELFGCTVRAKAAAEGLRVNGTWLGVYHCPENRYWYSYLNGQPRVGWHQNTMTSLLGALSADTWYWLVLSCPYGTTQSRARIPLLRGSYVVPAPDDAADTTGEHRGIYEITLPWPASVPTSVPDIKAGYFPVLLGNSGTIHSQSQPYAELDEINVYSGQVANIGQQVFSPAAGPHTVAGIGLVVKWTGTKPPDAPLVLTVRGGAGAISGGGTLIGTATVEAEDAPRRYSYVRAPFDGGAAALSSSTQYHVFAESDASAARGWTVFRGDTRSDLLQPTPTTTLNEVEQASYGRSTGTGQDDSYVQAGTANDRHDLFVHLLGAPVAPTGLRITPVAAREGAQEGEDLGTATIAPPGLIVEWDPTSLTTAWRAYIVKRRLRTVPASEWVTVYERRLQTGETAATVEATETMFYDDEAGWGVTGTDYASGWDYVVIVENSAGLQSVAEDTLVVANTPTATKDSWVTSNIDRWLNAPVRVHGDLSGGGADTAEVWDALGRDGGLIRVPVRVPARRLRLGWVNTQGHDGHLAAIREAAVAGRKFALLECGGDRWLGVPTIAGKSRGSSPVTSHDAEFLVADNVSDPVAGFNGAAEIVFDGTDSYALTDDDALLDPGTSPFTVMVAGRFDEPDPYVTFPGTSGDYASTPDSAVWNVSGTVRVVARVRATDYTAAAGQTILAHWNSTVTLRAFRLLLTTGGELQWVVSPDGSSGAAVTMTSSGASFVDGTTYWVGVEYDTSTGAYAFYKAADNSSMVPPSIWSSWTSVTSGTASAVTPFNGTSVLEVGTSNVGTADRFTGRIYRAMIYDDGVLVADFNPGDAASTSATSWTARASTTGETWTLNGGDPTINDVDRYLLSKGNPGVADGYAIKATAGGLVAVVDGAGDDITMDIAEAAWFDGFHIATLIYDGTTLSVYFDDEEQPRATTSTAVGAITNSTGLAVPANNGGASGHGAHKIRAWGVWLSELTDDQRRETARYLLTSHHQRVAVGASVFFDAADDRTWNESSSVLTSLAGASSRLYATLAGTWSRRGTPWPLRRLARWGAR